MPSTRRTSHADFAGNQIINALLHPVTSDPVTPANGQVWFRSDTSRLSLQTSGGVVRFATLDDVTAGSITGALWDAQSVIVAVVDDTPVVQVIGENQVLGRVSGGDIGALTAAQLRTIANVEDGATADQTAAEIKTAYESNADTNALTDALLTRLSGVEDNADVTDATNVEAAGAVMDSDVLNENDMVSNSTTQPPSQASVVAYVGTKLASALEYKGGYNASTNTPDLDTAPVGVQVGDTYTVSTGGIFHTTEVGAGDVLIAEVDDPATIADWTVVQRNLGVATTTVAGIVELATASEVVAAVADDLAITPDALVNSYYARSKSYTIGNGVATTIQVNHNLGTKDVVVSVREVSTDQFVEGVFIDAISTSAIELQFNTAPTTDEFRVTVVG